MCGEDPGQVQELHRAGPKFSCDLVTSTTPHKKKKKKKNSKKAEEPCMSVWDSQHSSCVALGLEHSIGRGSPGQWLNLRHCFNRE